MAIISVVMGSDSDLPVMSLCLNFLAEFQLPFEVRISSAHRLPEETAEFARNAAGRGSEVIIGGGGGSPILPGLCRLDSSACNRRAVKQLSQGR